MDSAETLKASGSDQYKAGNFAEAAALFQQAAALDPKVPIYLSNLSAAQFELGDYRSALFTCEDALELLPDSDANLRPKVVSRKAKCLVYLSHDDQSQVEAAKASSREEPARSAAIERLEGFKGFRPEVNRRLSILPRYRGSRESTLEFYTVGHDSGISLLNGEMEGDVRDREDADQEYNIAVVTDGTPWSFSALFCGIGDARHFFGTILDIGQQCSPQKGQAKPDLRYVNTHFTLIDIHPAALARDMLFFFALKELTTTDPASQRAKLLLAMLHYTYFGAVMPPVVGQVLDEMLERARNHVHSAVLEGKPLDIGWLYVEPQSCKAILERLEWWRGEGKTALSFDSALPVLFEPDAGHIPADKINNMKETKRAQQKQTIQNMLNNPEGRRTLEAAAAQTGQSYEEITAMLMNMDEESLEHLEDLEGGVPICAVLERQVYPDIRVLVPPPGIESNPACERAFRFIRANGDHAVGHMSQSQIREACKVVRKSWVINYTRLASDWLEHRDLHEQDPFKGAGNLFPAQLTNLCKFPQKGSLYSITSQFFSLVAKGFRILGSCLRVEVICGDGFALMDDIRMGTVTRREDYPKQFDRIHTSNVPDYVGGFLSLFTTAVPLLKSHAKAFVTACDLLHSINWEGDFSTEADFAIILDSRLYTYTAATIRDIAGGYGVRREGPDKNCGAYHAWGHALPDAPPPTATAKKKGKKKVTELPSRETLDLGPGKRKLLPRDDFLFIATGIFLRAVMPTPYTKIFPVATTQIRELLNVHSFFRALERWMDIGYPPHFLASIVECILENRLTRSSAPPKRAPNPLSTARHGSPYEKPSKGTKAVTVTPLVSVQTTPFLAEFEVAAALWESRLFPIVSEKMIRLEDVGRYVLDIKMEEIPMLMRAVSPSQKNLLLAFGRPRDLDATSFDPREGVLGKAWGRSLEFVSTFELDEPGLPSHLNHIKRPPGTHRATVLLSRDRVARWREEGYEACVVSIVAWTITSEKVRCDAVGLMEISGLVESGATAAVGGDVHGGGGKRKTRAVTDAQMSGWMEIGRGTGMGMGMPRMGMGPPGSEDGPDCPMQ